MSVRILITCVGGAMAPDLLVHLRADAILQPYLIGVDYNFRAKGKPYVHKFYEVPMGDSPNYVESILQIVKQEKVEILLPGSDQEAFVFAASRGDFAKLGVTVLVSPTPVLELIKDKAATYNALDLAGIRVPPFRCVRDSIELQTALGAFDYPRKSVIVKPVSGRGGRGMRLLVGLDEQPPAWVGSGSRESRLNILPKQEETDEWFHQGTLMVMPLLDSPAYDVDVLSVNGKAKAALVRERSNPAGIPFMGNHIIASSDIMDYCRNIAEALGLDALHDIDLLTDKDGRPCLLEVNPRPSGSVSAAHSAGFPIVSAAIAAKLGIDYPLSIPEKDINVGVIRRATVQNEFEV